MKRVILICGLLLFFAFNNFAQKSDSEKKVYPTVFQIGELPSTFEELSDGYDKALIEVCNDDMRKAHRQWQILLKAMEKYSYKKDFDLKGIKMWIKVFWGEDGSIEHIAFHLKPNSKNTDKEKLESFLNDFMKNYKVKVITTEKESFSQYSTASFPTLPYLD